MTKTWKIFAPFTVDDQPVKFMPDQNLRDENKHFYQFAKGTMITIDKNKIGKKKIDGTNQFCQRKR